MPARAALTQPATPSTDSGRNCSGSRKVVVDAPVDDVDRPLALGGAHVHLVVAAEQVAAFDQLDTHLPGQQRMLEVRRVVHPRGQHHDGRSSSFVAGAERRSAQQGRVVVDHPMGGEQVGKTRAMVRRFSITYDTPRAAQVVLEHPEVALLIADHVDARDVDAHAVGRGDAHGLAVKVLAEVITRRGMTPSLRIPVAVDVVEVELEGLDPLGDARRNRGPLGARDDPWHQVQRERPLLAVESKVMPWSMNARARREARAETSSGPIWANEEATAA